MSDFLANLAATTLQAAASVQPRTPALFEPRAPQSAAPLVETSEEYRVDASPVQPTVETGRIERANVTRSNTSSRSTANVLDAISQSEVTTRRSELRPATITRPPVASAAPLQKVEPSSQVEQAGRVETARSIVEETSTLISPPSPTLRPKSPELIQPRIERQAQAAQVERETAEPRIHISIGRIEVRAATVPAPARAAKREAAVLGLDDYLRQRR